MIEQTPERDPLPVEVLEMPGTDRATILGVVILGILALGSIVGVVLLAYVGQAVPDVLVAVASGAVSAIGALLVGGRVGRS